MIPTPPATKIRALKISCNMRDALEHVIATLGNNAALYRLTRMRLYRASGSSTVGACLAFLL